MTLSKDNPKEAKAEKKDPEFEDILPRRKYLDGEIPS